MRTFTINGKTYKAKPFTFNLMCDFEHYGVSIDTMDRMPMETIRTYFILCSGLDTESAGVEIEQHYIGGGDVDKLADCMRAEMEDSAFFRSLAQRAETETGTMETEAQTETVAKPTRRKSEKA